MAQNLHCDAGKSLQDKNLSKSLPETTRKITTLCCESRPLSRTSNLLSSISS